MANWYIENSIYLNNRDFEILKFDNMRGDFKKFSQQTDLLPLFSKKHGIIFE